MGAGRCQRCEGVALSVDARGVSITIVFVVKKYSFLLLQHLLMSSLCPLPLFGTKEEIIS